MQISSTPTAYGGGEAQRLLSLLLHHQGAQAGQDVPAGDATSAATASSPTQPAGGSSAAQFTSDTLSSLLSAQEAPPSSSDVAAKVISTADTNGDGSLSLDEIEKALGQDTTSGADALRQAFSKLDTNGDSQISADELTSALDAKKAAGGAHHGHHAHHAEQASSTDLANQVIGEADTNGDGELSATELSAAIDAFRAAHNRSGPGAGVTSSSAQAVTA
jgi:Ca2+-binding EF-hand superfamily protein